jgi:Protein of unknown function (DUF2997)
MAEEIVLTFENGKVAIDLNGFHGEGCHALQQALVEAVSGTVLVDKKKSEYYKPALRNTSKKTLKVTS